MASAEIPWITSHQGFLLKFEIARDGGRNMSLSCQALRLSCSESGAKFDRCPKLSLQLANYETPQIIHVQKCKDSASGILKPYALIQDRRPGSRVVYMCLSVEGNASCESIFSEFYLKREAEFVGGDAELNEIRTNQVVFLDGPVFLWLDYMTGNICHVSCEARTSITVATSPCVRTTVGENDNLKLLCWKDLDQTGRCEFLLMGHYSRNILKSEAKNEVISANSLTVSSELFAVIVQKTLGSSKIFRLCKDDVSKIIPQEYSCVLNSVLVKDAQISSSCVDSGDVMLSECQSHVFACTSQSHLLEFCSGKLIRCFSIECCSVSSMMLTVGHLAEPHIGLWSPDDHIFIGIRCKDFEVKVSQSGVGQVIVDDFLERGNDQVVILFSSSPLTWPPRKWLCTDLGAVYLEQSQEGETAVHLKNTESSSSMDAALGALQLRLQTDIVRLQQLFTEVSERDHLINQTCQSVRCLTLNQEPVDPEQLDLVQLCGTEVTDKHDHVTRPSVCLDWLEVRDRWQRLYDGKWVIGIDVYNKSDRHVSRLSLSTCFPSHVGLEKEHQMSESVWPVKRMVFSSHQVLKGEIDDDWIFKPSSIKQRKTENSAYGSVQQQKSNLLLPGEVSSVVCVIPRPVFGVDKADMLLLFLRFRVLFDTETDKQSTESAEEYTMFCGHIEFSKVDLFGIKFHINLRCEVLETHFNLETQRNHMCMVACQRTVRLLLMSTQTRMDTVTKALTAAGFTYNRLYNCHVCPERLESMKSVRVQLLSWCTRPVVLIHCRDKPQLWSVLHYLYHLLPDDVLLVPECSGDSAKVERLRQLQLALRTELDFSVTKLSELLSEHIQDDDVIEQFPESAANNTSDKVSDVRENFTRMRRELAQKRKDALISVSGYRSFITDFEKLSQTTDNAVVQLEFGKS